MYKTFPETTKWIIGRFPLVRELTGQNQSRFQTEFLDQQINESGMKSV